MGWQAHQHQEWTLRVPVGGALGEVREEGRSGLQ